MRLLKFYSQSGCQYECTIEASSKDCGCTAWNFPQDPLQVCDNERINCFFNEIKNVSKSLKCLKECLPDCEKLLFSFSGPYIQEK